MSKYTTELRFIVESYAGNSQSVGYNSIDENITKALPKIFDFYFPIFDEKYRSVLEKKIVKHFYTREICEETVGLWKLRLDAKLNEIMPFYNKLYESELLEFNPLYTTNLKRTSNNNIDSKNQMTENTNQTDNDTSTFNSTTSATGANSETVENTVKGKSTSATSGNETSSKTDLFSETPQGSLSGLENSTYLTNARKLDGNNQSSNNVTANIDNTDNTSSSSTSTSNIEKEDSRTTARENTKSVNANNNLLSIENYLENVSGYSGVSGSDLILKFRKTFINIDTLIIDELESLFFGLW